MWAWPGSFCLNGKALLAIRFRRVRYDIIRTEPVRSGGGRGG